MDRWTRVLCLGLIGLVASSPAQISGEGTQQVDCGKPGWKTNSGGGLLIDAVLQGLDASNSDGIYFEECWPYLTATCSGSSLIIQRGATVRWFPRTDPDTGITAPTWSGDGSGGGRQTNHPPCVCTCVKMAPNGGVETNGGFTKTLGWPGAANDPIPGTGKYRYKVQAYGSLTPGNGSSNFSAKAYGSFYVTTFMDGGTRVFKLDHSTKINGIVGDLTDLLNVALIRGTDGYQGEGIAVDLLDVATGVVKGTSYPINGVARFYNVQPGAVKLKFRGYFDNAQGASTTVNHTVTIEKVDQAQTLYYNLAENGGVSDGVAPGGGGGQPFEWDPLEGILQNLFVPSQASVDALKENFQDMVTWGPFNLWAELLQINDYMSLPHENEFSVPMPSLDPQTGMMVSTPAGTGTYIGLPQSWIGEGTIFEKLRILVGWLVYAGFGYGLMSKFFPRQTV